MCCICAGVMCVDGMWMTHRVRDTKDDYSMRVSLSHKYEDTAQCVRGIWITHGVRDIFDYYGNGWGSFVRGIEMTHGV